MTDTVLGLAWAGLVLAGASRLRRSLRPRARLDAAGAGERGPTGRHRGPLVRRVAAGPLERLGRATLRLLSLRAATVNEPVAARRAGLLAVGAAAAAVSPVLLAAGAGGAWVCPRMQRRRRERRRLAVLEAGLPEVVDLLALAVGAGANVSLAVAAAGRRGTGPLAAELARVAADVGRGRRLADALDELPARCGEPTRPLVSVLTASERYGSPLGPALERLGDDVRRQRQRRAEEAARKVPVLLLFPLVLCILPAFALLTVAPLVAGALRALRL